MHDKAPVNRLRGVNWEQAHNNANASDSDQGGVRRLLADVTELGELQFRLMADDTRCLATALIKPIVFGAVALTILLAALPVLLLAIANVLVEQLGWSPAAAQFAVIAIPVLVVAGLAIAAIRALKQCGSPLSNSLAELDKNMSLLREMLTGQTSVQQNLEELERKHPSSRIH